MKIKHSLSGFVIALLLSGCYSFTGGSVPPHLKTINISAVKDNSGYGNPLYKQNFTQLMIEGFQDDNSFKVSETGGDAKLDITIVSIRDETVALTQSNQGTLENERKISVSCSARYFDALNKKEIWKRNFTNYKLYELANAQQARDEAIQLTLEQLADDILLAVVSGW